MKPLVSILIPCYNAARWLAETLESALAQTWPAKEVIVVDDGSTDESASVARRFADRGVRLLVQTNRGASAARNVALAQSRGSWIQFLDADDILAPDKLERQLPRLLQEGGDDLIATGAWARFHGSIADARFVPDALWQDLDPVPWQTLALGANLMMHPAAWLIPRGVAERAGPWDESLTLNDDGEYFCRVRFAARRILFVPEARSYYRSGIPGSLSSPYSRRALESSYRSHELIHGALLAHSATPETRQACADAWMHFAFQAPHVAPDLYRNAVANARALGGSTVTPGGGRLFRILGRTLGWRTALRLRHRNVLRR